MKFLKLLFFQFIAAYTFAQGPPITGDKAIMLSEGTFVVKTLTESLNTDNGNYFYAPLMIHYLPSSNFLAAVHIPYVSTPTESGLADIVVRGKYQFYRNDMKARTHRLALKSVHWIPTGVNTVLEDYGNGEYQTALTVISGYETLKHGIGAEFGYKYVGGDNGDYWIANVGFGLPLLKPTYPVNQLNLYFEYNSELFNDGRTLINYSQGIQYARDQLTLDLGIQVPLVQSEELLIQRNYKLLIGARYIW
jgi:hypothetical protein